MDRPTKPLVPMFDAPDYADLVKVFGPPGGKAASSGRVHLPFAFPLAWDTTQRAMSYACHTKAAPVFTSIFAQAARHYGEKEFRRLRLDLFGGCYSDRPMRGSSKRSTHAWGIAWDIDPIRNKLKWGRDRAALAGESYVPFWNIVESHGAVSLGRTRNFDWMHFQLCK